jgi:hypothetical protein
MSETDATEVVTFKSQGWVAASLGVNAETLCRLVASQRVRVHVSVGVYPTYCVEDVIAYMNENGIAPKPQNPHGKPWLDTLRSHAVPTGPATAASTT